MVLSVRRKIRHDVASKALLRATAGVGMTQAELAQLIGLSAASLTRIASGERALDTTAKEGELALLVLRILRSLDALVGGDESKAALWLRAVNTHLGGVPLQVMQSIRGLVDVADYVDALRGKV